MPRITRRSSPPRTMLREQRSIIGVRDSTDPAAGDLRFCRLLRNVYPLRPEYGVGLEGRPGYAPMGDSAGGRVQALGQFTLPDGTERTVRVAGGALSVYDWSTDTWGPLSLGVLSISSTGPVALVEYAGHLIISDGLTHPIAWDGDVASPTFTSLTNCPPLKGQPGVYYAKLTGLRADEPATVVWSEEGELNVGYESGGYNNAWEVTQSEQEAAVALDPNEGQLTLMRARSTTAIFGAVSTDFTTTGTREAISRTIGIGGPFAYVASEHGTWWLDADGRPQRYRAGMGLDVDPAPWVAAERTAGEIARGALSRVRAAFWPKLRMVFFAVPGAPTADECDRLLAFDALTGAYAGEWDGFEPAALAVVKDSSGEPTLIFGDTNGQVYAFGQPDGNRWADTLSDGAVVGIAHEVHGAPLGYDLMASKFFDRLDLGFRSRTSVTETTVGWITPNQELVAALTVGGAVGAGAQWDSAEWDEMMWVQLALERHEVVGLSTEGRYMIPVLRHSVPGERFGVIGWTATILLRDIAPSTR